MQNQQGFGQVNRKKTAKDFLQEAVQRNYEERKREGKLFIQQYEKASKPLRDFINKLKKDYGIN